MKDAVLTVRLPRSTREQIEKLAQLEGRSLSQQVQRLLEQALRTDPAGRGGAHRGRQSLSGVLSGGVVPTLDDFRVVRAALTTSLERRLDRHDQMDRRHPRPRLAPHRATKAR